MTSVRAQHTHTDTHTHTHTHSTHTQTQTHTHTLSLSLSLSHTHTHMYDMPSVYVFPQLPATNTPRRWDTRVQLRHKGVPISSPTAEKQNGGGFQSFAHRLAHVLKACCARRITHVGSMCGCVWVCVCVCVCVCESVCMCVCVCMCSRFLHGRV